MLVGCSAPPPPAPIANLARPTAPAQLRSDTDTIIRMILDRFVANPENIPDGGLVSTTEPILVVVEVADGLPPTAAAFPAAKRFVFDTMDSIQHRADTTNTRIGFLHITIGFGKEGAGVSEGGDIALPGNGAATKLCCCTSSMHYSKAGGTWKAGPVQMSICS
jgi:hypothetical protein